MTKHLGMVVRAGVAYVLLLGTSGAAWAQGGAPDYDFDWVTIGDVNNAAYSGPGHPNDNYPVGRGSVPYAYRIARTEVTTTQWAEFLNTFTTRAGVDGVDVSGPDWFQPRHWGAFPEANPNGPGVYHRIENYPAAAQQAVAGITWRQAARFCNWLHNGKSSDPAALVTGAYDTTTWSPVNSRPATDAPSHLPGAKFWIPTLDEWIKAGHYDPNKNGPGEAGWWRYPNQSDVLPISGLPGIGETSAGTDNWEIPVGSYPLHQSAYGLLDVSGGAAEWLEDVSENTRFAYRRHFDGTSTSPLDVQNPDLINLDDLRGFGSNDPYSGWLIGLRVASIPSPSGVVACLAVGLITALRRRNRR